MTPESEISEDTPIVIMDGSESRSTIGAAKSFSFPVHEGNKISITVAQRATVMLNPMKFL